MIADTFESLYVRWSIWAKEAGKSEPDWASDFVEWPRLIAAASEIMLCAPLDNHLLSELADCWAASEEGEELCDFAKANIGKCLPVLWALSDSSLPACRWQIYEAAVSAGPLGEGIIRKGLVDADAYARRRAILAMARLKPRDARDLAASFMKDTDPYIRQASIDLIRVSEDDDFRERALVKMTGDPEQHVRAYATKVLKSSGS